MSIGGNISASKQESASARFVEMATNDEARKTSGTNESRECDHSSQVIRAKDRGEGEGGAGVKRAIGIGGKKKRKEGKLYGYCPPGGSTQLGRRRRRPITVLPTLGAPLLLLVLLIGNEKFAHAQCPWARDSIDLHSDCICDFNPQSMIAQPPPIGSGGISGGANTDYNQQQQQRQVARRMSVQCAPVDFEQLLRALRQTASIELPLALAKQTFLTGDGDNETTTPITEALEDDKLRFISQAKLDLLHVSNSSIGRLESNTFVVDAKQRQIEGLESRHLVVAIQSLHLSRCGIAHIASGAFNGLEWSLASLSLADNQLETVPSAALESLTNLALLDLSNNNIKQIGSGTFVKLNKLHTLRLADNKLIGAGSATPAATTGEPVPPADRAAPKPPAHGIEEGAFEGLEATLNDLSLKNLQLSEFPRAINRLRKLAFLNLAQNQIGRVPPRMFEQMSSLTAINLERNRLTRVEDETFAGVASTLSSLSLLGNLIENFPVRQLEGLRALRRLDLGFNQIQSLPPDAFASSTGLMLVALDGNPLETLPEETFKPLIGTLKGLSVGGKSLNCDCRLSWMIRWQLEHGLQISSRERAPQFCAHPPHWRSLVSFVALKPEHFHCETPRQFNPSSTLGQIAARGAPNYHSATTVALLTQSTNGGGWTASTGGGSGAISRLNPDKLTYVTLEDDTSPSPATTTATLIASPALTTAAGTTTTQSRTTSTGSTAAPTTGPVPSAISERSLPDELANNVTIEYVESTTISQPPLVTAPTTTTTTRASIAAHEGTSTRVEGDSLSLAATTRSSPDDESNETDASDTDKDEQLVGEASTTTATSAGGNQLTGGGALSGAEEGSLVVGPMPAHEPNRRKSNRHGHLAPNDLLRFNKTTSGSTVGAQSIRAPIATTTSQPTRSRPATVELSGVFGDRQPAQPVGPATTTPGPIPAVASTASFDSEPIRTERARLHRPTAPNTASRTNNNHALTPSLPTTINVYKTHTGVSQPESLVESHVLSGSVLAKRRPHLRYESSLLKGARFVGEDHAAQQTTTTTTTTVALATNPLPAQTSAPAQTRRNVAPMDLTSGSTSSAPEVDLDLERYSQPAASSVRPQIFAIVTPPSASTIQPAQAQLTDNRNQHLPPHYAQSTSTSTTGRPKSTTLVPDLTPPQIPHFNTRMSVSSMYRLAAGSPPRANYSLPPMLGSASQFTVSSQSPSSTTTSTTIFPPSSSTTTTTTTTPEPVRTDSSGPTQLAPVDTTTRMSATIRIVDSLRQVRIAVPPLSARPAQPLETRNSSSTTGTTTTTPAPSITTTTTSTTGPPQQADETLDARTTSANSLINQSIHDAGQPTSSETHNHQQQQTTTSSSSFASEPSQPFAPDLTTTGKLPGQDMSKQTTKPSSGAKNIENSDEETKKPLAQPPRPPPTPPPRGPSLAGNLFESSSRLLSRRLPKLFADFDQAALILAGLMCVCIFLVALIIIICTCCSLRGRKSGPGKGKATSNSSNQHSQSSSPVSSLVPAASSSARASPKSSRNCLARLLYCCCCCFGRDRRVTPMRSLILQDDVNSTSSSSAGGSSSNLVNGNGHKSMLLASNQTLARRHLMRPQHKQSAGSHLESSCRRARKSNTLGQPKTSGHDNPLRIQPKSHFLASGGISRSGRRTQGRRKSGWSSEMDLDNPRHYFGASRCALADGAAAGGWLSDSCDSDKSYSPGANKNNRYNISEAHAAHLAGKQIQASMFVSTHGQTSASNGRRGPVGRMGLLKTIDVSGLTNAGHGQTNEHYGAGEMTQLGSSPQQQPCDMIEDFSRAHTRAPMSRSISMSTDRLPVLGRSAAAGFQSSSFGSAANPGRGSQLVMDPHEQQRTRAVDFATSAGDLMPITAEEEWPEPYQDPLDIEENTGNENLRHYHLEDGSTTFRPAPTNDTIDTDHHCQDRQYEQYIQKPQMVSGELPGGNTRTYDDAYLANWRTISRQPSTQQPTGASTNTRPGGGANWLRWTPTCD